MSIEHILKEAKETRAPYPKTFEKLKDAGVASYSVSWDKGYKATYEGTFGEWEESPPEDVHTYTISSTFSKDLVKKAIIDHAHKKTGYGDFLEDLSKAGVSHYHVDMEARTVTYYDASKKHSHEESVPS